MSDSVIKHAYLENEDSDIILAFAADICDSVEKTAVATEAHAKNSWFYSVPVRRLCKATSNIAIGASIVPGNGGNCVAQTIEELMANASNLAEPMSGDVFDDAASLDDGIYPIQEEDLQVIKADMVECDDGDTVEEKLTELNADIVTIEHGTLTPTLTAGYNDLSVTYSKDYVGNYIIPSLVLTNAHQGQNQQIQIIGLNSRGTNGCQWRVYIDAQYVQYLSSPVFEWTALCQPV